MSKRSSAEDRNSKAVQVNVLPEAHRDDNSQIVEMAAEQFADLLWRHWLYIKEQKKRKLKKPKH